MLEVTEYNICSRVLGENHPSTLTSMANLAFTWKSQGRLDEALALMRRCVEFQQRILGPDHPSTISNFCTLRRWERVGGRSHGEAVDATE